MISLQVHKMSIYFFKVACHETEFSVMTIVLNDVYLATGLRIWEWVDFHS